MGGNIGQISIEPNEKGMASMNAKENINRATAVKFKSYVIQGAPISWARARLSKERHFYDAQAHLKVATGLQLINQQGKLSKFSGPLSLEIVFFMPVPHSTTAPKKLQMAGTPHKSRPDLDNLLKYILDVATGICYTDDAQIATMIVKKQYDRTPRTEFTLSEIV